MGVKITVNDTFFTDSLVRSQLLDSFSSPVFAVSAARLLRREHNGPLMTVRRPSDNLELDVYANNRTGLLDEAALLDFAGSEDLFVKRIYNQTESGGFFGQAESSLQPRIVEAGQVIKAGGLASLKLDAIHWMRAFNHDGLQSRPFAGKTTIAAAIVQQYTVEPEQFYRALYVSQNATQQHAFSLRAINSTSIGYSAKPCLEDAPELTQSIPVSVGELNQLTVETHLDTGNNIVSKNGNVMGTRPIERAQCSVISSDPGSRMELGHFYNIAGGGGGVSDTLSQLISEVILFNTNTGQDIREIEANQVSTYVSGDEG